MKKLKKWFYILLPVLICGIFTAVYGVLNVLRDDTKAPVITIDSEVLEVSVTADDAALLQGVTAEDRVDGDVTDRILVEGISAISEKHTAVITYAAFDSAGNVAKKSRTLQYTDYEPPVFSQRKALVLPANASVDVLACLSASDKLDGDISSRIKGILISNTNSLNNVGLHEVEFRVTNSMGDTAYITLPVEVYASNSYSATVELKEYLVYVKKGTAFNPRDYLSNVVIGSSKYSLRNQNPPVENLSGEQIEALGPNRETETRTYINRYVDPLENKDPFVNIVNVKTTDNVNILVPGTYSVTYTVDFDGLYTGYTRLNVVVED